MANDFSTDLFTQLVEGGVAPANAQQIAGPALSNQLVALGAAVTTAPSAVLPIYGFSTPQLIAGDSRVVIRFRPPQFGVQTGGSYLITLSNGAQSSFVHDATKPIQWCVFTGLTNGVAVTATVRAVNTAGQGPASPASNSATPTAAPFGLSAAYTEGLLYVLDASRTTGYSDGATVTANAVPDLSGNGHTSSGGVGVKYQATGINGKPSLSFNNGVSNSELHVPLKPHEIGGGGFIAAIRTIPAAGGNCFLSWGPQIASGAPQSAFQNYDGTNSTSAFSGPPNSTTTVSSITSPAVISIDFPGNIRANGQKGNGYIAGLQTTPYPVGSAPSDLWISSNNWQTGVGALQHWGGGTNRGDVAGLLIWAKQFTAAEQQAIVTQLALYSGSTISWN